MPTLRIAPLVAAAGIGLAGLALSRPLLAQDPGGASREEDAVRRVVQAYVRAREARDPRAIEPRFTADADQLVSDGTWRRGRSELVRGMLQSSQRTGGHRAIEVTSVRFVAPTVAVADGRYRQTGLAGGAQREMWTTLILTRDPQGWRIAGIRNMLPAVPAPASPPPAKNG